MLTSSAADRCQGRRDDVVPSPLRVNHTSCYVESAEAVAILLEQLNLHSSNVPHTSGAAPQRPPTSFLTRLPQTAQQTSPQRSHAAKKMMPTTRAPRKHSPKSSSHKKTSPSHHLQAATQHAQRTPAVPPRTRRNPMCNVAHYTTHPPELSAQKPPITCAHPTFHTRHSPPPARSGHAAHTPPSHHRSAHRLTQPLRVAHVAARPGPGCCGTGADGALGECDMGRWGRGVGGV